MKGWDASWITQRLKPKNRTPNTERRTCWTKQMKEKRKLFNTFSKSITNEHQHCTKLSINPIKCAIVQYNRMKRIYEEILFSSFSIFIGMQQYLLPKKETIVCCAFHIDFAFRNFSIRLLRIWWMQNHFLEKFIHLDPINIYDFIIIVMRKQTLNS